MKCILETRGMFALNLAMTNESYVEILEDVFSEICPWSLSSLPSKMRRQNARVLAFDTLKGKLG